MRKMRLLDQNLTDFELRETGIRELSQFEKFGVTTARRTAFRMPFLNRVLDSPSVNGSRWGYRKLRHRLKLWNVELVDPFIGVERETPFAFESYQIAPTRVLGSPNLLVAIALVGVVGAR